jgi:hypothetical protein
MLKANKIMNPREKANFLCNDVINVDTKYIPPSKDRIRLAIWAVDLVLSTNALVYEELKFDELSPVHEKYWVLVREYLRGMV